jgi:hypothetical protein
MPQVLHNVDATSFVPCNTRIHLPYTILHKVCELIFHCAKGIVNIACILNHKISTL